MKPLLALLSMGTLFAAQHLVEGAPKSPVRVVIYEDLQCPDCADFRIVLDTRLLPKYGSRVAFEHRDFPLAKHAWARQAAVAARYFARINLDLAVAWRTYALANLRSITLDGFPGTLAQFAQDHGQDPTKAVASLQDKSLQAQVEEDFQEGVARGIAHTPTALVNGHPFIETFTFEEISQAIDAELAAAK